MIQGKTYEAFSWYYCTAVTGMIINSHNRVVLQSYGLWNRHRHKFWQSLARHDCSLARYCSTDTGTIVQE